jgi:hypothetical protein
MPGTLTVTESLLPGGRKYVLAWTADANGDVSGAPAQFALGAGVLRQYRFIPGTGGNQPTNLYDVTLTDPDGFDVLEGNGANRSNVAIEVLANKQIYAEPRTHELVVAAAGNAKRGTVELIVIRGG